MPKKKTTPKVNPNRQQINEMLDRIRAAVAECRGPSERDVLEALVAEAAGWDMRLDELDAEG